MTTTHDFDVTKADGSTLPLATYEGKLLLIVNVASKCGLTPQYEGLEALYQATKAQGLEILGFPCNQFMEQEPGTDQEIQDFCQVNYNVTFPVMAKVDVNGENAIPLYNYLRAEQPGNWGPHLGKFYEAISNLKPDSAPTDVHWNFTKFLVARDGTPLKRYEPPTPPAEIAKDLEQNYL